MKELILQELKSCPGQYISGEEISSRLKVSRTAIWKCINQLKDMGYVIESQTKKGYRLLESPDSLLPQEITEGLNTQLIGKSIKYLEQVDSTNLYAKRIAEADFQEGTVIIAEEQLKGKGRMGRHWVSPRGKGIWMTIMLKPQIAPADAAKVTLLTACAVCRAIEQTCNISPQIKWPNDILLNGKKLCGILTEMSIEQDEINYLIVGIGINVNIEPQDLPQELHSVATSVRIEKGSSIVRKELTAAIINNFEHCYKNFIEASSIEGFLKEYKERSALLGREVTASSSFLSLKGKVLDITKEGQLLLQLEDGSMKEIISGEVSVRGLSGYID
jgi:BirA family biotin operon repressor/biotin-[acetyl-CoA-carboxylase] ligase